ncbi:unnamed protein product [Paramecium octaurelia]|uniref:Transmembrane protein n=1 Tax=Paramecium octaurelia TaxID=43137 RepID=A0A8S1VHM0_PAROT|nr:unnamed protein product [Paramecium octaurelia]
MAQQQGNETIVPILVTQEEYNEIMKQPDYMQQQLLQQLQQKKYEEQQQIYQHPYLQYQNYQKQQDNSKIETQSPVPSYPINNSNQQQQQYYYTPQQQLLQQYNQNLNQNYIQKVVLHHKEVEVACEREVQFFNQNLAKYFSLELTISLLLNSVSALFRMKIINHYWHWSSELWVVISLYILLNLFILTNPKLILQKNHQKFAYVLHVILYSLLLQGLQIAIQGYEYFFWNYFYFFYFMITSSFISVCYFIQQKGINQSLSTYLPAIIAPPSIIFLLQLICVQRFYLPLFLWGIVIVFLALGLILLFRRINKLGYNKHQTNDFYAMASILHMLMISPFYDNE